MSSHLVIFIIIANIEFLSSKEQCTLVFLNDTRKRMSGAATIVINLEIHNNDLLVCKLHKLVGSSRITCKTLRAIKKLKQPLKLI